MESLRKWFYRPKRDDKSLLAQFFYADEALNIIASELDSFDGRKDPGRCTTLVNQLRQSQDKVLTITNAIMDVLIGDERANRDFRVKFPEDVLQENLAGQLWFGAECLAAGSSIMNKEAESTAMRPLAKAVTKSLENVRNLLRETCLRNNTPNGPIRLDSNELVTELLLEGLKIFDKLFAEFELAYVSAMVPVKTTQEYELQEFIGVLFSETLQRALKMKLLTQEMVDDCDPALMFAIPRLAIVSGLLIFPNGPLCIDKPVDEMSNMFRPFRTLLHKIRELLWTLNKRELYMLEKLLCDNEQINNIKTVSDVDIHCDLDRFYDDYTRTSSSPTNILNNHQRTDNETTIRDYNQIHDRDTYEHHNITTVVPPPRPPPPITTTTRTVDIPSTSGYLIPNSIAHDIIVAAITDTPHSSDRIDSPPDRDSLEIISVAAATLSSILTTSDHADDNNDEKKTNNNRHNKDREKVDLESPDDSGVCTENTSLDRSPSLDMATVDTTTTTTTTLMTNSTSKLRHSPMRKVLQSDYSPSSSSKLAPKLNRKKKIPRQIEGIIDEDSSSVGSSDTSSFNSNSADDEEIAMAMQAAQIATRNEVRAKYRSSEDLIHRLFVCIAGVADQLQTNFASDLRNILKAVFLMNTTTTTDTENEQQTLETSSLETSLEYRPSEDEVIENNEFSVDPNILAQEALFDTNVYFHLENEGDEEYSNHPRQQNHHHHHEDEDDDLASELNRYVSIREEIEQNGHPQVETVEQPPVWIPDVQAPRCMSCEANFTVVKRRHHCRNCGKVFCSRCSSNSVPLPKFGHHKPVRVCNKCFIYNLTPFTM